MLQNPVPAEKVGGIHLFEVLIWVARRRECSKEHSGRKREGHRVSAPLFYLLCHVPQSSHQGSPGVTGGWEGLSLKSILVPGFQGPVTASLSLSFSFLCENQRLPPHTVLRSLPVLEPLRGEVGLGLPHLGPSRVVTAVIKGSPPVFTS